MPVTKIMPRYQILHGLRKVAWNRTPYGRMKARLGARNQPCEAKAKGGRISGRRNKELGAGIFAPGMQSKGGRRRIELYGNPGTPESSAKGRRIGIHIRWHRNRNYFKNDCQYCWKEL